MNLSNDGLVAFHYKSYGTFFLQQNRLHNIHRGFTYYKYYRAFLNCSKGRKLKRRNSYRVSLVGLRKIKGDCIFLKYGDGAL